MVYTALLENGTKPTHTIKENEYDDTGVATDFRCVYDKQVLIGDDAWRLFDPINLPDITLDLSGNVDSPFGREYIVEVTANGFVNIHHRMPIAFGQLTEVEQGVMSITSGLRLADSYLPDGAMPTTWPIGYGYSVMANGTNNTENVVWLFNDLYDKANFTTSIDISTTLETFMSAKNLSTYRTTCEFLQKMTTDSYIHKYYAIGTSLTISKHDDGNNEDVVCRIRILRKELPAHSLVLLPEPVPK